MKKSIKKISELVIDAAKKYKKDNPVLLAGTTAYFTIFAIAPILIIIISAVGLIIGEEDITRKVYDELNQLLGSKGADFINNLVENYENESRDIMGALIGFGVFLLTSTTFFIILQNSLNFVWRVRAKPKHNFLKSLKDRLLSFAMILSLGFVLLVSLFIDAALAYLKDYLTSIFPNFTIFLMKIVNFIISFGIITLIFAMIYKFLPDVKIKWRVTWIGAIITAGLFTLGKYLIGFILGSSNISVMYGAAGSVVIFLLWVFYSSIILFFGAEITQQYAEKFSRDIEPAQYAVKFEINEVGSEKTKSGKL